MFALISKAVVAFSLAVGALFAPQADVNAPIIPVQDPSIERDRIANRIEELQSQVETLGAYNPSGGGTYRLKTSIGTTNTTVALSQFEEPVSEVPYTMAYLNTSVAYGTLDPQNTSRSEFISFTGITQNADGSATLTGVTRGLARSYPFTASSTLRQAHSGQSIFILSDSPQHFNEYAVKQNDETITGQWTFDVFPITASSSFASETAAGWVELATGAEAASSTASGTAARLALPASLATSSCQVVGRYVPITDPTTGKLAKGCITGQTSFFSNTYGTTTFSVPAGVSVIKVTIIGGGGTGGLGTAGSPGVAGSGGGAGGVSIKWYDVSSTSTLQYHVGTTSEASWFGGTYSSPTMLANGGSAGTTTTGGAGAYGGAGGTATGGDINITGEKGGTASIGVLSGDGGSTIFGYGGRGGYGETGGGINIGLAGTGCGVGGGGSTDGTSGGVGAGVGAAGCLIIEY